jgi:ribosome-binding factor A
MSTKEGRAPSQRQLRVGEALRHALSDILMRGELRDPALQGASITVSEVRVSPDLRNATAYVVPLGGAHAEEILAGLQRAGPHLRAQVARAVKLKFAPGLTFRADTSFDYADRIERLLHSGQVARDLGHGDADDAGTAGRRDQADEPEAADERESADEPGPAGGGGRHGA